ncbi:MAG: CPBP family intramembrane metalloprotease [Bdellovibrionales bacterium]|nr:CPBP family intramembrane metalloprotease [Bdellovibrionales bacterium]MCB0417266.1 CPBP family intramembrane metalloprotease [Bdellovibrionales bacterium]
MRSFAAILLFEFGLGGVAAVWLAWTGGVFPLFAADLRSWSLALSYGIPLFGFAFLVTSDWGLRIPGFGRIYEALAHSFLGELIERLPCWRLVLLSLSAGFGEEMLFRSVIQPHLGVWATAFVFGLLHALTPTYFLVALSVGAYLGLVFDWTGGNLFVPVAVHTVYDFLAFMLYRRRIRAERQSRSVGF